MITTGREQRRFERYPWTFPVKYRMAGKPGNRTSQMVDLSEGGIGFWAAESLARGSQVSMTIPVEGHMHGMSGEIVYCNHVPTMNRYRVGARFRSVSREFVGDLHKGAEEMELFREHMIAELGEEITREEAVLRWISRQERRYEGLF